MTPSPAQLEAMWEYVLTKARRDFGPEAKEMLAAVAETPQEPRPPKIRCMRCDAERDFGVESCLCGDRTWRSEEPPERFESPKRKVHITPEGSREVDPHEILASPTIRMHLEDVHEAFHPESPRPSEGSRSVEARLERLSREIVRAGWNWARDEVDEALRLYREERAASEKDYKGMREFQAKFIKADHELREARERIEKALAAIEAWPTDSFRDRFGAILRGTDTTREEK